MVPSKFGRLARSLAMAAGVYAILGSAGVSADVARVTPPQPDEPLITEPRPLSIPHGAKLRLVLLSTAKESGDPVLALVERAPAGGDVPEGSVLEGYVMFTDDAGVYHGGSLTVRFNRITPAGDESTQALEPFEVRFKARSSAARLNRILLGGCPLLGAAFGAATAGRSGIASFAPSGLGVAWASTKDAPPPVLRVGERRNVKVGRIRLGLSAYARPVQPGDLSEPAAVLGSR